MTLSTLSHLKSRFIILTIAYLCLIAPIKCNFREIRDLNGTDSTCLNYQAQSWTAPHLTNPSIKTFDCAGTPVLGGNGIFQDNLNGNYFTKTYYDIVSNSEVRFAFTLYGIDSWSSFQATDGMIEVIIGSTTISSSTSASIPKVVSFKSSICGSSLTKDAKLRIFGRAVGVYTSDNSVTIQIGVNPTFQFSTGSFAVRDLSLNFVESAGDVLRRLQGSVTTGSMCGVSTPLSVLPTFSSGQCACDEGKYYDISLSACQPCSAGCKSCFGPTNDACYECKPGYTFDGANCVQCLSPCETCVNNAYTCTKCLSATEFLYKGNCWTSCPYPTKPLSDGCTDQCRFPCPTGQVLYPDWSCLASCDSPLTLTDYGDGPFCDSSCPDYLNYDGSCVTTCPTDSTPITVRGIDQCTCPNGQYLYWDATCQTDCSLPLKAVTEFGMKKCTFPCSRGDFLYSTGLCDSQCNAPFVQRDQFCDSPCRADQYLNPDNSCRDTCSPPLRVDAKGFCIKPCDDPMLHYNEVTNECKAECDGVSSLTQDGYLLCSPSTATASGGLVDLLLIAPTEPDTVTVIALTKFMQYVRYLDVKLPPRLEGLSISKGRSVLSLQPTSGLTTTIYSWFNNATMAPLIERQNLHPRFLANFGGQLFILIVLVGSAILFSTLTFVCKRCKMPTGEAVFEKFQTLTRWNLCFMMFATYFDDIILYSTLEFITLGGVQGSSSVFSFLVCVGAIAGCLVFMGVIYKIVMKPSTAKVGTTTSTPPSTPSTNQSCQIFFGGFKAKPHLNKLFYLFYVSRSALPILLGMVAANVPVVQVSLQVTVSVVIIGYALIVRPLTSRINQYQLCLIEGTVLIMNIGVLVLTIFDSQGIYNTPIIVFFGDLIIIGNVAINVLVLVILVLKIFFMGKDIRNLYKKNKTRAVMSSINVLALPLQQGAFGFEQLIGDINPPPAATTTTTAVPSLQNAQVAPNPIQNPGTSGKPNAHPARIYPSQPNTKQTLNKMTTNAVIEEEPEFNQNTDRLGQSSARLLMSSSQVMNQSQADLVRYGSNLSMNMNDSGIDLGTHSPKATKGLSNYLNQMNGQNVKTTQPTRQSNTSSYYGGNSVMQNYQSGGNVEYITNQKSTVGLNQVQKGTSWSQMKREL